MPPLDSTQADLFTAKARVALGGESTRTPSILAAAA